MFSGLGQVSIAEDNLYAAQSYFKKGLYISQQLSQNDPHSAKKKRDLSMSFNDLGDVSRMPR